MKLFESRELERIFMLQSENKFALLFPCTWHMAYDFYFKQALSRGELATRLMVTVIFLTKFQKSYLVLFPGEVLLLS